MSHLCVCESLHLTESFLHVKTEVRKLKTLIYTNLYPYIGEGLYAYKTGSCVSGDNYTGITHKLCTTACRDWILASIFVYSHQMESLLHMCAALLLLYFSKSNFSAMT